MCSISKDSDLAGGKVVNGGGTSSGIFHVHGCGVVVSVVLVETGGGAGARGGAKPWRLNKARRNRVKPSAVKGAAGSVFS